MPAPSAVVYRDAALADGHSDRLALHQSVFTRAGRIGWIRPIDDEGELDDSHGPVEVVDASGSTIVPGLVDAHSHLTMPGGAHWIERALDPPDQLVAVAERNGELLTRAGVRWARDVGSPQGVDPADGRRRALALGIRDRWRARVDRPYVRAAGTWVMRTGTFDQPLAVEAANGDELLAVTIGQLDDGADLVKLYLDGPDPDVSPWSVREVAGVVAAVHARGARVTAHSGRLDGARVGAEAGVDSLEHGFELDASVAATMKRNGVRLVSTLCVMRSWLSFSQTTDLPRFATDEGRAAILQRLERAEESVRLAHAAGVLIAAGTDFGGGSTRANQLAWEVEALVSAGLEPWEALAAATWRGGELLAEPEAGALREGGPADFVLVHGDPLSDPSSLWRTWRISWA